MENERSAEYRASACYPTQHRFGANGAGSIKHFYDKCIARIGENTPVLPLQTIPGIPELFIIAMYGTMVVGAVFLSLKLVQSLREFREGYKQGTTVNQSGEVMCPHSECDSYPPKYDSATTMSFCPDCRTNVSDSGSTQKLTTRERAADDGSGSHSGM